MISRQAGVWKYLHQVVCGIANIDDALRGFEATVCAMEDHPRGRNRGGRRHIQVAQAPFGRHIPGKKLQNQANAEVVIATYLNYGLRRVQEHVLDRREIVTPPKFQEKRECAKSFRTIRRP